MLDKAARHPFRSLSVADLDDQQWILEYPEGQYDLACILEFKGYNESVYRGDGFHQGSIKNIQGCCFQAET